MTAQVVAPLPPELRTRQELRDSVFFAGSDVRSKMTRFWMLLVLASVIAASGVVGESEATVIGAMVVAPLRIPILGTMLAIVLGERSNLFRSAAYVIAGGATATAVGFAMGILIGDSTSIATNSQVITWSQAGLIDLVAALATGAVGSIALARRDVADALPGIAIAVSLVPPLTVLGLALEAGESDIAWGAFLLFATNVSAILAVGVVVIGLYRIRYLGPMPRTAERPVHRWEAYLVIGVSLLAIGGVLTQRSISVTSDDRETAEVQDVVSDWATTTGWEVVEVTNSANDGIVVRLEGPLPLPTTDDLPALLRDADLDPDDVEVKFVPTFRVPLGDQDDD